MLLLSLIIFFHNVLLHCGQGKAEYNNEFMDYSITEFWWNGTPGIDQTDRITPDHTFLSTPIGRLRNTDYSPNFPLEPQELEMLYTFTNTTRPSYPFGIENHSVVTPSRPGPWYIQYPGTTPSSYYSSDYRYPTIHPYTGQSAYIASPSERPPKEPSFTLHPEFTYASFSTPPSPPTNPPGYVRNWVPSSTSQSHDYPYKSFTTPSTAPTNPPGYVPNWVPSSTSQSHDYYPYKSFTTPSTAPTNPPGYVPDWIPSSTSRSLDYYPFVWNPEKEHVKKWQQEISSYAAVRSIKPTNVVPMISQVFNYDDTTEGFPEAFRRIPKTTQDASSKLTNSVLEDPSRAVLREAIRVLERNEARDSEFEDEASLYGPTKDSTMQKRTKNTQTLTDFLSVSLVNDDRNTDDDIKKTRTPRTIISRLLRTVEMLDKPATIPKEERWQSDQTVPTTLTTVKESVTQKAVLQSYFEMIEALEEGYMMVFLIELTRLIATKERKAVRDVVKHTDQIINSYHSSGQLQWLGKTLLDVTTKVARLLKILKIDVIQNHAANMSHMLSQRHEELSVEVNTILEYADMLYDDNEGRHLFNALHEFAVYPNISLTGYLLCNSLIHNFLRPYRRFKDTQQRQELMNSVNLLLKTRLSSTGFNEGRPLRHGDDDSPDDEKLSTKKELVTQTELHTSQSPRERKRKRHHRSHKRNREGKRYTDLT